MRTCVNLSKLSIIEALHNKSFLTIYVGISLEMHFEYLNVTNLQLQFFAVIFGNLFFL